MGKTSLKRIIFENLNPNTLFKEPLESTKGVESNEYDWLNIELTILDLPNKENDPPLKDETLLKAFENVDIVLYIFDFEILKENTQKIIQEVQIVYKKMRSICKKARLILIYHKIDRIPKLIQNNIRLMPHQIQNLFDLPIELYVYYTSIYEDLIYSVHNTFSDILSSFSEITHQIKKLLDDLIKKYSHILTIVIDNQNKIITQSKSNDYNINLICDSFETFNHLKEKFGIESFLDNESHIFKTDNKIRIVRILRLNFLKSNLEYLIGISESFNERKLDELMHNIEKRLIDFFKP